MGKPIFNIDNERIKSLLDIGFGMTNPQISAVDISAHSMKLVTGKVTNTGVVLDHVSCVNIFSEDRQEYENNIQNAIKQWKKEGLISSHIYINLSFIDIVTHRVELPKMPYKEVREALKWTIKDQISFNIEEAEFDYEIIGERVDESGAEHIELVYAALKRERVSRIYSIFKKSDFTIWQITISPFCLLQILNFSDDFSEKEMITILDIGSTVTHIAVYKDKKLIFTRDIPLGSKHLSEALMEPFESLDNQTTELSFEESEEIKIKYGLPIQKEKLEQDVYDGKIKSMQMYYMMRPILELFVSEISRSLEYLKSHYGESPTNSFHYIYITGGGAQLKNMEVFFQDQQNWKVAYLPLDQQQINSSLIKVSQRDLQNIYSCALATVLSHNKKFNLLPVILRVKKIYAYEKIGLRMGSILVGLLLAVSLIMTNAYINYYRTNINILKTSWKGLEQFVNKRKEMIAYNDVADRIYAKKVPVYLLMVKLSNAVTKEMLIDRLKINQENHTLNIRGYIFTETQKAQEILTVFITDLTRSILFKNIDLKYVKIENTTGQGLQEFEIGCMLNEDIGYASLAETK